MGQHLTVYHIKEPLSNLITNSYESLLSRPNTVKAYNSQSSYEFDTRLFRETPKPIKPPWQDFLKNEFNTLPNLSIKGESAVLFVKFEYEGKPEIFAFTFGQGRFLINPDCYDEEYGLRVALNVIYDKPNDPARVKSVSTTTISHNTIRTIRQTERYANFNTFQVDTDNDNLDKITGIPVDAEYWSNQMTGGDSLTAEPTLTFRELKKYCESILKKRKATDYLDDFEWIDKKARVVDERTIGILDACIIPTLKNKPENLVIAFSEVIEQENIIGAYVKYKRYKEEIDPYAENASEILAQLEPVGEINVEKFSNTNLSVKYTDGTEAVYPIYQCLSGEIEQSIDPDRLFIVSEGKFYEFSRNYLERLNKYISSIPKCPDELPKSKKGETEGAYNKRAAKKNDCLLLLDQKNVRLNKNTSPIEICDLLSNKRCFIHVKRKLRSSTLSHLLEQGYVSAVLLQSNKKFRKKCLTIIQKEAGNKKNKDGTPSSVDEFCTFSEKEFDPKKYQITYGIVANWKKGKKLVDSLPFFSKVNLRSKVADIKRRGYKVSYACIGIK